MITVGLDFGTHQTKICVESRNGTETHYKFNKLKDWDGNMQYTLPSVLCVNPDKTISYGYIDPKSKGQVKRYFKQAVFRDHDSGVLKLWQAAYYSIWYLAYILFDLEELYGKEFTIQMGAPTDSIRLDDRRAIAVTLLVSAYHLVENVFKNDKSAFLKTKYDKLIELTKIEYFSEKQKKAYGILVFPEAYACLMPLIARGKIAHGMSFVIDIGGGTTDISFFTIEETVKNSKIYRPQLYDYFSINKGLNYLTGEDQVESEDLYKDFHIISGNEINSKKLKILNQEILNLHDDIVRRLKYEWTTQTIHDIDKLKKALRNRPLIYTGGGSTIGLLRRPYEGFSEIHQITYDSWKSKLFDNQALFKDMNLCPVLSTAYGLSISVKNDIITKKPFRDIFEERRKDTKDTISDYRKKNQMMKEFDYGLDDDAWK